MNRFILLYPLILLMALPCARAELPYRSNPTTDDPYDYRNWLYIDGKQDLPITFQFKKTWWLTDYRGTDPAVIFNPQEFYGVRGMGANRAWEVTTGRPDVTIAILDSGILWQNGSVCSLLRKHYLNRAELPMPESGPNPNDTRFGGYDVSGDGIFNIEDYWSDSRVSDLNGNGWIDPEDLILLFSDGTDGDNNGYIDDISGWDFFENDNNPRDDVNYRHGTEQSTYAGSEAIRKSEVCPGDPAGDFTDVPGVCPNCMIVPLRVGDSFVADANNYAAAVVYAVDNGITVVESALGTLNHTSFGQEATNLAYNNGVIVNASAADEGTDHLNWPSAYEHTLVHNSLKPPQEPGTTPYSYLYLNGCTNYGPYIHTAIPSTNCSSQATGLASGVSGLLVSAARNAVEGGTMTNYPRDDGSEAPFPLSVAEMHQLWRLASDDIDFASDFPKHAFSSLWSQYRPWWWFSPVPSTLPNNYETNTSIFPTRRHQSGPGWDYFTGYGRINAARLVRFIGLENDTLNREFLADGGPYAVGEDLKLSAQDRIPPEADIIAPRMRRQYGYRQDFNLVQPDDPMDPAQIVISGRVAANRVTPGGSFTFVLEWAPGAQGAAYALPAPDSDTRDPGPWTLISRKQGLKAAFTGELGRLSIETLAATLKNHPYPFDRDPTGPVQGKRFAVRLRLRVIASPGNAADTVNNEAVTYKQVDVYPAPELIARDDLGRHGSLSGGCASPSFYDLDGDGHEEMLLPTDDGLIHAYKDVSSGLELENWPVTTDFMSLPTSGDNSYTRCDPELVAHNAIMFGTVAVADLDGKEGMEVLMGDNRGKLYAWHVDGSRVRGFPVTVNPAFSAEPPCGPGTIPDCDGNGPDPIRNQQNRREGAFNTAPAVGDLDPNYPGPEIVAAAADGHIYAWHGDGTPVPGWPVFLRDPNKIASMDPVSHVIEYTKDSCWLPGTKANTTPSLGDIDGDGFLEVIASVNEQYEETPSADLDKTFLEFLIGRFAGFGNTRVYALEHTGSLTPETEATRATVHLHDQAYVPGWPVPIGITAPDVLPTAGQGSNAQPALGDLDGDGDLEIIAVSHFGPAYVLNGDGSSFLGTEKNDKYKTLERKKKKFGADTTADDGPSYPAFNGMILGIMEPGTGYTVATGTAGINRLIEILLVGQQKNTEDQLSLWDPITGAYRPNAPLEIADLQFFATPIMADINGNGSADVIQLTSGGDMLIADASDTTETARVLHTGGWGINSAGVGGNALAGQDQDNLYLASVTREGNLRLYMTGAKANRAGRTRDQWPQAGHDSRNTGNVHVDTVPPAALTDLAVSVRGNQLELYFTLPGDNGLAGPAAQIEIRFGPSTGQTPLAWETGQPLAGMSLPADAKTGPIDLVAPVPASGKYQIMVRARDAAGNQTRVARASFQVP